MRQPTPSRGVTLTQYSPWVWHVIREGKRIGTVSGDSVAGFIARDIHHHSIGHYFSTEAAVQAWAPLLDSQV